MLIHDLHIHTIRSQCGTMTLGEVVARAVELGMRSVAITDHGTAMDPNRFQFHILTKRFPDEWDGVRVYKGIELNVLDADGTVDMPMEILRWFDYVAVGLHPLRRLLRNRGAVANTDALIAALRRNPWIDTVNHPTQFSHPLDLERLLPEMARQGIAFEVNDCNLRYRKSDLEATAAAMRRCVDLGVPLVANSDTHVIHEMGSDELIGQAFARAGIDPQQTVNATQESVSAFIEARRERRQRWVEESS